MRSRFLHTFAIILFSILFGGVSFLRQECSAAPYKLLVIYTQWAGWFYHNDAIEEGKKMFEYMAIDKGFDVDFSEDPIVFTDANLEQYDAIAFLDANGDFLNDNQKVAFQNFIRSGKGWVGTHCVDNTLNDWDWYHDMIGSTYRGDAGISSLPLIIMNENHPSTKDLPNPWNVSHQQYRKNTWSINENTPGFNFLIKVDPALYEGHIGSGSNDWSNQSFVPFIYTHEYEGGRAWYGGMGHDEFSFKTDSEWYNLISWGVDYAFGKFVDTTTAIVTQLGPSPLQDMNYATEVYLPNGTKKVLFGSHYDDTRYNLQTGVHIIKENGRHQLRGIKR